MARTDNYFFPFFLSSFVFRAISPLALARRSRLCAVMTGYRLTGTPML